MMASGKSTVGALLAQRLGWRHLDGDREVERRAGCSVAELFRREGEHAFRAREAALTEEWVPLRDVVLSPGGGWAAQPGLWERLRADTLFVWLRVGARAALARTRTTPGERPLLAVADPDAALERLLREREPAYARAGLVLDTEVHTAAELARQIEAAVPINSE